MNKKLLLLALLFLLALTACNKNKETTQTEVKTNEATENKVANEENKLTEGKNKKQTTKTTESAENTETKDNKTLEDNNTSKEKENENKNPNDNEKVEYKNVEEEIKALEEKSDYISIIKMSQTGPSGKEIHVVEDLKGSLKNIVIPEIPNMQANYNYLIFLKDSENGDITLTDSTRGLALIENDTDEKLLVIKELLKPAEEKEVKENK